MVAVRVGNNPNLEEMTVFALIQYGKRSTSNQDNAVSPRLKDIFCKNTKKIFKYLNFLKLKTCSQRLIYCNSNRQLPRGGDAGVAGVLLERY